MSWLANSYLNKQDDDSFSMPTYGVNNEKKSLGFDTNALNVGKLANTYLNKQDDDSFSLPTHGLNKDKKSPAFDIASLDFSNLANNFLNKQEGNKYSLPSLRSESRGSLFDQIQPLKLNTIIPDLAEPPIERSLSWKANQEHWLGASIADQKSYFDADVFKDKSPTWKANQEHWLGSSCNVRPSFDWANSASNECYDGTPVLKPTFDRAYEAGLQMVEWGKDFPMYGSARPGTDEALVPFTGSDPGLPMYGSGSPIKFEAPISYENSDPMCPSALPTCLRSSFDPMAPRYLDLK